MHITLSYMSRHILFLWVFISLCLSVCLSLSLSLSLSLWYINLYSCKLLLLQVESRFICNAINLTTSLVLLQERLFARKILL